MCGIFGAVNLRGTFEPGEYERFLEHTDMVHYRGPDDAGYVAFVAGRAARNGEPFSAFLGHRRLSILDLSEAGHQPMYDDGGLWLTFNGEIFNFIELREQLKELGHHFRSSTDSEVILKLYKQYGEAGFAQMNGMWALALLDLTQSRLILSRDRFSMKPLYIAECSSVLYFGSEIKQLTSFLPSLQPNLETMVSFLDQALCCHTDDTFVVGVRRAPAATNIVIDLESGQITSSRYWSLQFSEPGSQDASIRFRDLLCDSIRIRLRSDVKVGMLLSGGLDSSALSVLTNTIEPGLETYSVISDGACSEELFIDAVNDRLTCRHIKIRVKADAVLESINRVLYHQDEPMGGFNVVGQFLMMEAIRRGSDCKVLLSGQGADEVVLGYLKYFYFYIRELWHDGAYVDACTQMFWALLNRTVLHQFRPARARRYKASVAPRPFLRTHVPRTPLWDRSSLRDRQVSDIERYSIPALTHYEDRSAMAFGLEVRHPFLDHRLVELAVNMPACVKIKRGWLKHVLRDAVPELPPAVRWRRDKQGFVLPEGEWLKRDLFDAVSHMFQRSALADLGVLDARAFLRCYQQFRQGSRTIWHNELTRVVMAEMWIRQLLKHRDHRAGSYQSLNNLAARVTPTRVA